MEKNRIIFRGTLLSFAFACSLLQASSRTVEEGSESVISGATFVAPSAFSALSDGDQGGFEDGEGRNDHQKTGLENDIKQPVAESDPGPNQNGLTEIPLSNDESSHGNPDFAWSHDSKKKSNKCCRIL